MARRGRRHTKRPRARKVRQLSLKARKWISRKIRFLVKKERRSQKQAAAIAYSMARKRGFKVPKRSKHLHRVAKGRPKMARKKKKKTRAQHAKISRRHHSTLGEMLSGGTGSYDRNMFSPSTFKWKRPDYYTPIEDR